MGVKVGLLRDEWVKIGKKGGRAVEGVDRWEKTTGGNRKTPVPHSYY